jgi:hypothetical protein
MLTGEKGAMDGVYESVGSEQVMGTITTSRAAASALGYQENALAIGEMGRQNVRLLSQEELDSLHTNEDAREAMNGVQGLAFKDTDGKVYAVEYSGGEVQVNKNKMLRDQFVSKKGENGYEFEQVSSDGTSTAVSADQIEQQGYRIHKNKDGAVDSGTVAKDAIMWQSSNPDARGDHQTGQGDVLYRTKEMTSDMRLLRNRTDSRLNSLLDGSGTAYSVGNTVQPVIDAQGNTTYDVKMPTGDTETFKDLGQAQERAAESYTQHARDKGLTWDNGVYVAPTLSKAVSIVEQAGWLNDNAGWAVKSDVDDNGKVSIIAEKTVTTGGKAETAQKVLYDGKTGRLDPSLNRYL